MRRSHAQEALNKTTYNEGTNIQEHVKLLRTRKAAVDNRCLRNERRNVARDYNQINPTYCKMASSNTVFMRNVVLCRYYFDDHRKKYESEFEFLEYRPSCPDDHRGVH